MRSSYEYMDYLQVVQVFVRTPWGSNFGANQHSASDREINAPRSISDSIGRAQVSAFALLSKVPDCGGYPRLRILACQTRLPLGPLRETKVAMLLPLEIRLSQGCPKWGAMMARSFYKLLIYWWAVQDSNLRPTG